MREHRLGFAVAMLMMWAGSAFANVIANPTSVTCPDTTLNTASGAVQVTLDKGSGTANIAVSIGSCSGGAGSFSVNTLAFPQTVSAPATIDIRYTPTAVGTRTCTITATNGNGSDATIVVSGTGYIPPMITVSTPMPFNPVRVLDSAQTAHTSTRTVTVQNDGGNDLVISNVTFTGDFSIDPLSPNGTTATITAGNAKNWTIRFNPSAAGTRNGTVTFTSNATMPMASVSLVGDGTTGLYTSTASTNDFGIVVGGTTAGLDIAVNHTGGSPKGVLTFATVTVTSASTGWFAISAQPNTLSSSTTMGTVSVSCNPPSGSTAIANAVVTITADADANAVQTVNFTCEGGSSALALAVSSVDMDPTLVGAMSPAKTLVLMNTGNQPASVGFGSNSTNAGRFTVKGPGDCGMGANNCSVPAVSMITITMTFSPTLEATVSASFAVQGAGAAPSFIVTGRGIDRHILLPDSVQFDDTFRNPGTMATVAPVLVENKGEYAIVISDLTVNGPNGVWSVDDETLAMLPLTVPGLETRPVNIRFAPQEAGKADDGQLLITNDDTKIMSGMPLVILSGNGKDRNVDVTPVNVYLGETFAGISTKLSITKPEGVDHLAVKNNEMPDPKNNFVIREIKVQGDYAAMFEVVDFDGKPLNGRPLNAQDELIIDVVFKPTYPGEFDASLLVYLDEDTTAQPAVTVRGRALYIDAHGSGGCSAGHGSRGGMLLVLGALGLVLRRRRR